MQLQSDNIGKFALALSKAQMELQNISKSKTADGGKFTYDYADIADGLEVIRPVLAKNELAIIQRTLIEDKTLILETRLVHSSGEWMSGFYPVCAINSTHQQMGGAMTYTRRYALFAMVGVAACGEDDDGANAAKPEAPARKKFTPPPASTKPIDDEIPHMEAPAELASTPADKPEGEARVSASPSRKTVADVPTVDHSPAAKPDSYRIADSFIKECQAAHKLLLAKKRPLIDAINMHEQWKVEARKRFQDMLAIDVRRVDAERLKIEATIKQMAAAVAHSASADQETGELAE